jgi:hypothetical protein
MSGEEVTLHMYDLSQGMARQMSQQLLGRQVDAVYHTAVVAYGREWCASSDAVADCRVCC